MKVSAPVLALVDKPSTRSFALLPVVVDAGFPDHYFCTGLADASAHRREVPKKDFERFFPNAMLDLREYIISTTVDLDASEQCAVGWVGNGFRTKSVELELELPRELLHAHRVADGVFWFDTPSTVHARMREYIERAMREVVRTRNRHVAEMMHQTIVMEPETLAAMWYTCTSAAEQAKEIELQLKLRNQSGTFARKKIVAEHTALITKYENGF